SELLREVLGDVGGHARSAVGVAALPLDSPVEVDAVAEAA
ncbi:MAG: RidA family protein, partial [Actinomycetota bacterium]|nr:RidA family protein [Actinomycetota bacterium]